MTTARTNRTARTAALLAGPMILLLPGCFGPQLRQSIEIEPPPVGNREVREVVVSGFLESIDTISISSTRVGDYVATTRHDEITVEDVSSSVATGLTRAGVPAEARAEVEPEQLEPGQLLIRGIITLRPKIDQYELTDVDYGFPASNFVQIGVGALTMFMYGGVLPLVYPYDVGLPVEARVDIIAPDGEILARRLVGAWVYYDCFTIYGTLLAVHDRPSYTARFRQALTEAVADALRPLVTGARMESPGAAGLLAR